MHKIGYHKAIALLHDVASPNGFLASAENTTNYKRVWARDGVICGLAALALLSACSAPLPATTWRYSIPEQPEAASGNTASTVRRGP